MRTRESVWVLGVVGLFGCVTASPGGQTAYGGASMAQYTGPYVIQMTVTNPGIGRLPDEEGRGVMTLWDAGDGTGQLGVQMRRNGQRCELRGTISAGRFTGPAAGEADALTVEWLDELGLGTFRRR